MLDFSKNYFELFDLPVCFELDQAVLAEHYRALQKAIHPDRYANGTDQERRLSLQQSTQINAAYETLKNPLQRASYQLSLKRTDVESNSNTTMDAAFLMEQMELRESIAKARSSADPFAVVDQLTHTIKSMLTGIETALSKQLAADHLDAAAESVRKMHFLYKLNDELDELEAELDDRLETRSEGGT